MNLNPARQSKIFATICGWMFALAACFHANAVPARLDLNGAWQVSQAGASEWISATVPGCIHTDLLSAGKIPDPFYRDNERAVRWVGETNWIYKRTFFVPADFLQHDRVLLRCAGLDTLATVRINGEEAGRADNMFRVWEFDAKPVLKAGANTIEVLFASPLPCMKERQAQRKLHEWSGPHEPTGRAWVRKEPCNFGWDWGPVLITCGIWRGIRLEAFDQARFEDMVILQDHSVKDQVTLTVDVSAQAVRARTMVAMVSLVHQGKSVAGTAIVVRDERPKDESSRVASAGGEVESPVLRRGRSHLIVKRPKLWWPAGMGEQPLYEVRMELLDPMSGITLDRANRRIGLRTVRLLEADGTNSLRFEVNGVPFFAKGANWIPADVFPNRLTPQKLRRYVADAAAANMNVLRFWGGSYYEEDALFDACDELGLCVWMDCKFACSSYPAFDDAFMENVRREVRDNVRRLRHHPCIALWCGNNEISLMLKKEWADSGLGRADYDRLFRDLIGGEVKAMAPQANYVPGSPEVGDIHYWQVWHGGKPFEAYRSLAGFMSEFGFQSFPEPKTVRAYTAEADRASVLSPIMQWHQRSAGNGNEKIRDMTVRYFQPPKDFESALWLSQLVQGHGIKTGAEYWRQNMPKSMGCVFWQYNDCWPVASWSSVDYFGRWKALQYLARRFYAPVLVSGLENPTNGSVEVFVTSDRRERVRGTLTWNVTDVEGKSLVRDSVPLSIAPQRSERIRTLDLREQLQKHGTNNVLVWLKLAVKGETVSDNLVTFVPPKELKLVYPRIETSIAKAGDDFVVTIKALRPALWLWLSSDIMDAKYSDNFVHVTPDAPARIVVRPDRPMTKADFAKALRVRSLWDTYN